MSYQVTYSYHERTEDGKYNTEETKELVKKIGRPFEDLPLEKLAAAVMGQLARRDIWVVDAKVEEYVKKEVNYKESSDGKGIIIKGKKFLFGKSDELISEGVEEYSEEDEVYPHEQKKVRQHPPNNIANRSSNQQHIREWVVFDPEIINLHEAQKEGYKFTVGQKYPVYKKEEHPMGTQFGFLIETVDDQDVTKTINDKYFISARKPKLIGDFEEDYSEAKPVLTYANELKINPNDVLKDTQPKQSSLNQGIPVDNGSLPPDLMAVPTIRK